MSHPYWQRGPWPNQSPAQTTIRERDPPRLDCGSDPSYEPQEARELYSHLMEAPFVDEHIAPGQRSLMFVSDGKASYIGQKKRKRL